MQKDNSKWRDRVGIRDRLCCVFKLCAKLEDQNAKRQMHKNRPSGYIDAILKKICSNYQNLYMIFLFSSIKPFKSQFTPNQTKMDYKPQKNKLVKFIVKLDHLIILHRL